MKPRAPNIELTSDFDNEHWYVGPNLALTIDVCIGPEVNYSADRGKY